MKRSKVHWKKELEGVKENNNVVFCHASIVMVGIGVGSWIILLTYFWRGVFTLIFNGIGAGGANKFQGPKIVFDFFYDNEQTTNNNEQIKT